MYDIAQQSLQCYLKSTDYTLITVDLDNNPVVQRKCSKHKSVYYKKHCAAGLFLSQTDWLLVLDADT
ncbi:hypothetical protein OESDEN_16488, partial [Oesophagostomum dentatum]